MIASMLLVIGCATHIHKVGDGAQGNDITNARQWYILWGLVPINDVDTNAMAGGASDYQITTSVTVVDFLINAVGSYITLNARSVSVQK
ncbi:hypothetical protein JT359_04835 [Candidatus Poribacteria bacterium]|nr:hypothetical protein [Candidatus Poribacteria bacterium]